MFWIQKKPEEFEIVKDKIWWEGNPDKSKKYRRKKFEQKQFLTPRKAEAFLEVTGNWLSDFIRGKKGFPPLQYFSSSSLLNLIEALSLPFIVYT